MEYPGRNIKRRTKRRVREKDVEISEGHEQRLEGGPNRGVEGHEQRLEGGPNRGVEGRRQIKKLVPIEEWKDMDRDQEAGPNRGVEGHGQRSRRWSE